MVNSAMSRSQKRFAQAAIALRQDVQHYLWLAFAWLVGRINDWLLPDNRQLDAVAIASWCAQYLDDRNPGNLQFRGMSIGDREPQPRVTQFSYRGLKVNTGAAEAAAFSTAVPFVPAYQRSVRYWLNRLNLRDMDRRAEVLNLDTNYRSNAL